MDLLSGIRMAFAALVILCAIGCNASSFTEPHSHNGKVTPFKPGDPKVPLDNNAKAILDTGKPYQTQIKAGDSGGRGLVVQDIEAPTSIVWDRILDYDNYANMVPKTIESENYKVEENPKPTKAEPYTQTIYTRMKVGFPVLKLEFFVKHLYYPDMNSLTWTLDYTKTSDFDDSCGYWYIVPHPENESWTRVFYSVEVSMFDWVPKFVTDFMSTKALTDATAWVKKYSEKEYGKLAPEKREFIIVPKKKRKGFFITIREEFKKNYEMVHSFEERKIKTINGVPVLMEIAGDMEPADDEVSEEEAQDQSEIDEKEKIDVHSVQFLQLTLVCFGVVLSLAFALLIIFQFLRFIASLIF